MDSASVSSSGKQSENTLEEWVLAESQDAQTGNQDDASKLSQTTLVEDNTPLHPRLQVEAATEYKIISEDACQLQVVLSVVAPSTAKVRAPLRLVAILDKSGSMEGAKLELVRNTMLYMLRHLCERDALGLVSYDTTVNVLCPLVFCDSSGRARLEVALKQLRPGCQTNLSGGMLRGIELHREGVRAGNAAPSVQEQHVFLDAAKAGKFSLVRQLVCGSPALVNCQPAGRWTALHQASSQGDSETAKFLLENGASIVALTLDGETPVDVAAPNVVELFNVQAEAPALYNAGAKASAVPPLGMVSAVASQNPFEEADHGLVRSTFLFTDGLANVGITNSEDICAAAKAGLGDLGDHQCTLSTFGFGKDHSGDLLKNLAEIGGGSYSYVEDEDQIGQAFGEALGGLLSTTHQNVKLHLELGQDVSIVQSFSKHAVGIPVADDRGVLVASVELGDLFAEERRDILLTLSLPTGLGSSLCGQVRARGFSVCAKQFEETAKPGEGIEMRVERQKEPDMQESHPQIMRHRNRHVMTKALEDARDCARRGDLAEARRRVDNATAELKASPLTGQSDGVCLGLLADLSACRATLEHETVYRQRGSQTITSCVHTHASQRVCNSTPTSAGLYMNSGTRAMRSVFQANVSGYPCSR